MSSLLDIGDRLNEWIASTGFKKYEVAEKVGISVVQLSRILKGKSAMSFRLENAFRSIGADVDWILTGRRDINDGGKKGELIARYIVASLSCFCYEILRKSASYTQALHFVSKESLRFKIFIKICHPL